MTTALQIRSVVRAAVIGAVSFPTAILCLWLAACLVMRTPASQLSQWPIGVFCVVIVCGPIGSVVGSSLVLAKMGWGREVGWAYVGLGTLQAIGSLAVAVKSAFFSLAADRGLSAAANPLLYGAVFSAPVIIVGLILLGRSPRKR